MCANLFPDVVFVFLVRDSEVQVLANGVLQVKENHPKVDWVGKARWVVDGNIWTSSGVTAGMDLVFAWIAEVWGEEMAGSIADQSEYERNKDAGNDPFAEKYGVA
jgi:transcriptional regulator GlxA family with amidase domain